MEFEISANTDIGLTKEINQDSFSVKVMQTNQGKMAFAILCDGMGGHDKGELASATVVEAFNQWVYHELPRICNQPLHDDVIRQQWTKVIQEQNQRIVAYGNKEGIILGTTAVMILLTQTRYYIANIGDSRAYELRECIRQITKDHSWVAKAVQLGNMTEEEARTHPKKSILLQCIGQPHEVNADMFFGDIQHDTVYLLCSDGFVHEITKNEIYNKLQPSVLKNEVIMQKNVQELIDLNKKRKERDNISVVLIRTI